LALLVLGGTTGVAGCADPGAGSPTPSAVVESAAPSPAATLSDEEALRIAEETYRAYMDAEIAVVNDGGQHPEWLDVVASDQYQESKVRIIDRARGQGIRLEGKPVVDHFTLQGLIQSANVQRINFYFCVDISAYIVRGVDGVDLRDPNRPVRFPLSAFVDNSEGSWKLGGVEEWSGQSFC